VTVEEISIVSFLRQLTFIKIAPKAIRVATNIINQPKTNVKDNSFKTIKIPIATDINSPVLQLSLYLELSQFAATTEVIAVAKTKVVNVNNSDDFNFFLQYSFGNIDMSL
jgi:hypothetical protein